MLLKGVEQSWNNSQFRSSPLSGLQSDQSVGCQFFNWNFQQKHCKSLPVVGLSDDVKICQKLENNVVQNQSAKWTLESDQSPESIAVYLNFRPYPPFPHIEFHLQPDFKFQTHNNVVFLNLVFSCVFVQYWNTAYVAENFWLTSSTRLKYLLLSTFISLFGVKSKHLFKVETIIC